MPEPPIQIGILGAAWIAPMALIEPARNRDDVHVVTVAARDHARAQAFANEHDLDCASRDYAELVGHDDIDLVYVALSPDRHCQWTIAALDSGKAVLCEKPFALNRVEARAMVDAAGRVGTPLIKGFHYRFHRLMRAAVRTIRDGKLGQVVRARFGRISDSNKGRLALVGRAWRRRDHGSRLLGHSRAENLARVGAGGSCHHGPHGAGRRSTDGCSASVSRRHPRERDGENGSRNAVHGDRRRRHAGGVTHRRFRSASAIRAPRLDVGWRNARASGRRSVILRRPARPCDRSAARPRGSAYGGEDAVANMLVVDRIRALSGTSSATARTFNRPRRFAARAVPP